MKIFSGIKNVFSILNSVVSMFGAFINQNPTRKEKESIKNTSVGGEHIWEKKKPKVHKPSVLKKVSSKPKGKAQSETHVFNHPSR